MRVAVILLILALTVVGFPLSASRTPISARADTSPGSWIKTVDFPDNVTGESCVTDSGYVYCISGGYFARLTPTGITSWSLSTNYSFDVYSESCVADSGFVYCIGGINGTSSHSTSVVYFASLSSSGIGTWSQTTNYPMDVYGEKCVTNSGFVYCVGGNYGSTDVYFAQLSPTGVGPWSATTSYAGTLYGYSCVARQGYIYCIGGYWPNAYQPRNWVLFAPLSSQGVGNWTWTSSYPVNNIADQECVVDSDHVYCIGGRGSQSAYNPYRCVYNCYYPLVSAVDYATISDNGTSLWSQTESFPFQVSNQSCVVSSGMIYCIGGATNRGVISGVYFATLSTLPTLDFALSSSSDITVPQGKSASTTISVDLTNGTSQLTSLYCDRSYLGCSFSPQYGQTPFPSVLTIGTSFCSAGGGYTPVGVYVVRVVGTTNGQQHAVNVTVAVTSGGPPDVAVSSLAPYKNSAYSGILSYPVWLSVTTQNLKDVNETFLLSIYADSTLIESTSVTVAACESRVVQIPWQTGSMTAGLYMLTGNITSVPGETNLSNNQAAWNGLFKIHRLPADVNDDCKVDIADLALVGKSFGAFGSSNSDADIDNSGLVDIGDLVLVAAHFGHSC